MRQRVGVCAALLAWALLGGPAAGALALEWGAINPGQTTMDAVRARYGEPTQTSTQKEEQRDSVRWVYEGAQAPIGMERMVVDFGLLTPGGYRPQIVRSVLLHPKPGAFDRAVVVQGWGVPSAVGSQSGAPAFLYEEGLFVSFDQEGWAVSSMIFTPPQKMPPGETEPESSR